MMEVIKVKIFKNFNSFLFLIFTSMYHLDASANDVEKDVKVISDINVENAFKIDKMSLWFLHAEQWELSRSGESIMAIPVLKKVLANWLKDKSKLIEIRYPGGEEGEVWVQELMDWLISLGVPSNSISTVPGSGTGDLIKFFLV